jgi:hypothetical protein
VTGVADENPNPPIRRLSDNELVRVISTGFKTEPQPQSAEPGGRERNEKLAADELGIIESLRQNTAFQWFSDTCIEQGFKESRELLEEVDLAQLSPKAVTRLVAVFQTWRKIARWLDERELEHRRFLNPKDPHLDVIRARLDLH